MARQSGSSATGEAVVRFIFEMRQLREEARHGWLRIGENPESVAEHCQRAACLGYLLARLEGFSDPNLVCAMVIFHDMAETRVGDVDLVQKRYVKADEKTAALDQVRGLGAAGDDILRMLREVDSGSSAAGIIAKDSEVLEMAFTARELIARGNADAQEWMDAAGHRLRTRSAKRILGIVRNSDPARWWKEVCGI